MFINSISECLCVFVGGGVVCLCGLLKPLFVWNKTRQSVDMHLKILFEEATRKKHMVQSSFLADWPCSRGQKSILTMWVCVCVSVSYEIYKPYRLYINRVTRFWPHVGAHWIFFGSESQSSHTCATLWTTFCLVCNTYKQLIKPYATHLQGRIDDYDAWLTCTQWAWLNRNPWVSTLKGFSNDAKYLHLDDRSAWRILFLPHSIWSGALVCFLHIIFPFRSCSILTSRMHDAFISKIYYITAAVCKLYEYKY